MASSQLVQLGQLRRGDPGRGPLGGLPGQRGQDGEVVDGVLGGDPDDGDPAAGGDDHQALVGELEQGLADRGAAGAELLGDLVEIEPCPGRSRPVRMRSRSSSAARARTVPPIGFEI